ncbi:hypothetical protein HPB51_001590 [Rhipicephalus microplus]|uniref:Uncharacterized protein n=1 Tax=Rhipicephalus microplus TaxID=6941 RepID=A0A9J6DKN1_RHIMP|nr:hypothetical protein HPB51_001590 [Rhipicephalus microplus]
MTSRWSSDHEEAFASVNGHITCWHVPSAWLLGCQKKTIGRSHVQSCDRSHHTSDPNCPRRARQTPNKAWVRKALKKEQRELQPPPHISCLQRMATTGHSQVSTQGTLRARSKSHSRSRRKSQTRSKSRFRSRGASMRPPEKRPPGQTAPPSQQPYKKALLTNASAKVAQAPTETQRISAQKHPHRHLGRKVERRISHSSL